MGRNEQRRPSRDQREDGARRRRTNSTRKISFTRHVDKLCDVSVALATALASRAAQSPDGPAAPWARLSSDALTVTIGAHRFREDLAEVLEGEVCRE
jgi:hypothetical protein